MFDIYCNFARKEKTTMNGNITQSDDFKWFIDNHDRLYNLYPDKNLVIQDKTIVCVGNTFEEALNNALSKGLELGAFIVQECTEGEKGYTQRFSSRVVFA